MDDDSLASPWKKCHQTTMELGEVTHNTARLYLSGFVESIVADADFDVYCNGLLAGRSVLGVFDFTNKDQCDQIIRRSFNSPRILSSWLNDTLHAQRVVDLKIVLLDDFPGETEIVPTLICRNYARRGPNGKKVFKYVT